MTSKKFLDLTGLAYFKNKVQAEIDEKPTLPTTVNDKYLHTNATTGAYEWVDVTSGGGTVKKVKVNGTEQGPDASGTVDIGTVITAHQDISGKQDKSSLESDVAAKGFTKNAGTITSVKMNGTVVSASGEADLGTVITSHQDISGKENKADLDTDVSALGYTKNAGTVTGVKVNGSEKSPVSGVVDIGTVITEHQDITGKQDKSTLDADVGTCGYTKNAGTITEVKMNGASKGTSGVIDLGDVVTDVSGKLDVLGKEAGSQEPYKLPYFFSKEADASKMTVTAHTITMDNAKSIGTYKMEIPSATTANAGLMASADKSALDAIQLKDASVASGTLTLTKRDGTPVTFTKTAVADSLVSTSVTEALSANKGKELNDRIDNVSSMGRFLSVWNCATGVPVDKPGTIPYTYKSGDYYIVGSITTGTNYRPKGAQFTDVVSQDSEAEPDSVHVNDIYRYTTSGWVLQSQEEKEVTFSSVTGNPRDNSLLATELDKAVPKLGTEPGSGEQYHFPYNFNSIVQNADNISTTFDTVTLDGNKTKVSYNLAIPSADIANNKAGLYNKTLAAAKADVTALNTEATERQTADANLQTAINGEKTRAEGAESTLTTNLGAEVTRATGAETTLTNDLNTEVTNRTSADTTLQTNINAEKTRAETAETALQTAINGKMDLLGDAPAGGPYNLTYYFEQIPASNKVTVKAHTITLDNAKTQNSFSLDVLPASASLAGVMSATDKTKLDGLNVKDASVSGTTLTLTRATGGDVTFNGEPSAYIKNASASGNVLTLTKKDDTTLTFTGEPSAYLKSASVSGNVLTLKDQSGTDIPFTGGPSAYIKSVDATTTNVLKLKNQGDTETTFTVDLTPIISDSTSGASDKTYSQAKIKELIEALGGTFFGSFSTHAALLAATGMVKNDYAVVTADETKSNATTMYYYSTSWQYAYTISTAPLTFKTVNGEAITGTGNVQIIDDTLTTSTTRTYSVDKINTLTAEQDVNVELEMTYPDLTLSGTIATADLPRLANGQGSLIAKIVMGATLIGYSRVHLSKLTVDSDVFFNGAGWVSINTDDTGLHIYQPIDITVNPTTGAVNGGVSLLSANAMDFSISKSYDPGTIGNAFKTLDEAISDHVGDKDVHVAAGEKDTWNAKTTVTASASGTATSPALQYLTVEGTEWKVPQVSVPTSGSSTTLLEYLDVNGTEYKIPQPTSAAWGSITGTLSSQTDLNNALDGKINTANIKTSWGTSPGDGNVPSEKLVKDSLDLKASTSALETHTNNGDIHVTLAKKNAWDAKLGTGDIRDMLTSTATDKALSANQGKVLNDLITALTARVAAIEANYLRSAS